MPGQHVVDDAEVDVPGDRAALGPLEVDLGDAIVLDHRDALLADVDRDQQLALGGRKRRPARRLAPSLRRRRSDPVRRRSAARSARWLRSGFSRAGSFARLLGAGSARVALGSAFAGRPLAPTAATAPAPSLAPRASASDACSRSVLSVAARPARPAGSAGAAGTSVVAPSGAVCSSFLFFHRNQGKECLSSL